MKVLIIEGDQDIASLLSATLAKHNCVVDLATDGEMGLAMVDEWDYDIILLDVTLPKLDGITVCRQLRQRGCATPIMMLTAQSSTKAVVTGLDAGADDYVTKPFDPQQVLARLRALQRRQTPAVATNALTWGELVFDTVLMHVTYAQQEVVLSPKEYALLELLLRNPKRIFSRSAIIDKLWTIDEAPAEPTVTNLVKDLRQKLRRAGLPADPVETLHGSGYRLKSPPDTPSAPEPPVSPLPVAPLEAGLPEPPDPAAPPPTLEQVAEQFQANLNNHLAVLESAQAALSQGQLTADLQAEARAIAHRLTGSLGTFGYSLGSDTLRAIEHLLSEPFPLGPEQAQPLARLLATLRQRLSQPPSFGPDPEPSDANQHILIVDGDEGFTHDLAAVAHDLAFAVQIAPDLATAHHRLANQIPDAIVVNLGATVPRAATLTFLEDLTTDFPDLPVLVLADRDSLSERTAITPYRVQRFIAKPIQAMALLAIVSQVLAETQPHTATAIIVDDDPMILKTLSGLLLARGVQTTCLLNPSTFWPLLKAINPALLLLDLAMPGCNGLELCKTIRQDAQYRDLPILVITVHTDADSIQQAFAAGADEVLSKPIPEAMLLTRINQYLTRRRVKNVTP
jgi:DNA-binding response OmpR family regulator/HPt (histidine-containing phosphotransfer) domain-containing protein